MNKLSVVIFLVSVCAFASFAEEVKPLPEGPTFSEIRNAASIPEMARKVKSGRFTFAVNTTNNMKGYMMLRAKQYDQVRIDAILNDEHYCAVRNGEDFWIYNKKDGKISMSAEDREDFEQYIALLPFPVSKKQIFSKPVFIRNETVKKSQRAIYESKGSDMTLQMSVDTKTKTLRKIRVSDKHDKVGFIKIYSDYKSMSGINLPHRISISRVNVNIRMQLINADINLELEPAIFDRKAPLIDHHLSLLRENKKEYDALKTQKKTAVRNKAQEEQLERKIMRLKNEIQDCERRMQTVEKVSMVDRSSATAVGTAGARSSHQYWNGYGWGYRGSGDRSQRRMQKALTREIKALNESYMDLSDKLMRKRAELSEAEYDLKKLKGQ